MGDDDLGCRAVHFTKAPPALANPGDDGATGFGPDRGGRVESSGFGVYLGVCFEHVRVHLPFEPAVAAFSPPWILLDRSHVQGFPEDRSGFPRPRERRGHHAIDSPRRTEEVTDQFACGAGVSAALGALDSLERPRSSYKSRVGPATGRFQRSRFVSFTGAIRVGVPGCFRGTSAHGVPRVHPWWPHKSGRV